MSVVQTRNLPSDSRSPSSHGPGARGVSAEDPRYCQDPPVPVHPSAVHPRDTITDSGSRSVHPRLPRQIRLITTWGVDGPTLVR